MAVSRGWTLRGIIRGSLAFTRPVFPSPVICVLPAGRRLNAASAVMARTLRRLRSDWVRAWGHPVLVVETFVDPGRHVGTCYGASSFLRVGQTAGFGRRSGRYVAHGEPKDVYVKSLHRHATRVLAGVFEHPLLLADPRSSMAQVDFNTADLSSLLERLEQITDPRAKRGVRHSFASTLMFAACGTLAGHKSLVALSEWSDACSQDVLVRVKARISPATGLRIPPSYATIRRVTMAVDADEFDTIVNGWAAEQPNRLTPPDTDDTDDTDDRDDTDDSEVELAEIMVRGGDLVGVAVDGKTLRGARRDDGTKVQLLAAVRHDTGMIIGQRNVDNDKTNEILALPPLLEPLDIAGLVVTADAMHTQRKAADLIVTTKAAHYILGVKMNQRTMWNAGCDARSRGSTSTHQNTRPSTAATAASTGTEYGPQRSQRPSSSLTPAVSSSSNASHRTSETNAPASRPGSTSPTSPNTKQAPHTSSDSSAATRASKASTGSATSPTTKTAPRSAPAPSPASSRPYETSRSA